MEVRTFRQGSGVPLLLIHGIGADAEIWRPLLPALTAHCDVLAVDLPGFGRSPLPGRPLTPVTLAASVADAMDSAGWADAHLVGHSLGGRVAADLAAAGRARTLTLLAPTGMASRLEWRYAQAILRLHRALGRVLRPAVPRLARLKAARAAFMSVPGSRPWRWPAAEAERAALAFIDCPGWASAIASQPRRVSPATLAAVKCPVQVLWGSADLLLPAWQARRWAAALPHATVRRLPRLGHTPMADAPEVVTEAISDFVLAPTTPARTLSSNG